MKSHEGCLENSRGNACTNQTGAEVIDVCVCAVLRALFTSLSLLLFVLVTVVTKPLTLQEQEDRRQTWPGQQYPPSYQNIGEGAASRE